MDEKLTYQIYEEFQKQYNNTATEKHLSPMTWLPSATKKTVDPDDPAGDIRSNKHWKVFTEVYEKYKNYDSFDPAIFVKAVFYYRDQFKKIYPGMLTTHEAYKAYIEYMNKLIAEAKSGGTSEEIARSLTGTKETICRLLKIPRSEVPSYESLYKLFNEVPTGSLVPIGIVYCIHGMLSPYYLATSKSFRKAWKNLDPDIKAEIGFESEDDFEPYVGLIRQIPKVYNISKTIFGEDIL